MSGELGWHDEAELHGVRVRVHFFDPALVDADADAARRLLPVFGAAPPPLEPAPPSGYAFTVGGLGARPDAVFAFGSGLISLVRGDIRRRDRDNWRALLRIDAVLRSLATAIAVAGERQLPTVAMLRDCGALYQIDSGSAVLECLAAHIGDACRHWRLPRVAPAQLASFCEPKLRALAGARAAGTAST